MELLNARGTRDLVGADKIARDEVVSKLKETFEIYGYIPLETPILERQDVLTSKFAGGAEIVKEIFSLKDQGKRELALRYDLTVPMSRYVAMNPTTKLPFKNYKIGPVFRDGPIKLGRYRQFTQCDVDIIGSSKMASDSEIIDIALDVFERLRFDVVIKVNNRKILNAIMESLKIAQSKIESVILTVDKLEKIGETGVIKELEEKGIDKKTSKSLLEILNISGTNKQKISELRKILKTDGLDEIEKTLMGKPKNVEFDLTLARGLNYYTGTVFEGFLKKSEIKSAICGGGRYDKLIGDLVGNKQEYPSVGISFGLDVISDALKLKGSVRVSKTQVYVIPIKTFDKSYEIVQQIRKNNIAADIDLNGKGISKNLDYANSLEIPYVMFVGEKELSEKKVKLRDMQTGKEQLITVEKAIKLLS